ALSGYADSATGDFNIANISILDVSRWEDQTKDSRNSTPSLQIGLSNNNDLWRYTSFNRVNTVSPVAAEYCRMNFTVSSSFAGSGSSVAFRPTNMQYACNHIRSNASGRLMQLGEYATATETARSSKSVTGIRFGRANGTTFHGRCL